MSREIEPIENFTWNIFAFTSRFNFSRFMLWNISLLDIFHSVNQVQVNRRTFRISHLRRKFWLMCSERKVAVREDLFCTVWLMNLVLTQFCSWESRIGFRIHSLTEVEGSHRDKVPKISSIVLTVNILTLVRSSMTSKFCLWTSWFLTYLPGWTSWNFRKKSKISTYIDI